MKNLQFNLQRSVVPITIKEDGTDRQYELREMTAADRDRYLDRLGARVKVDEEGKPVGVKEFNGMQSDLLALCLWDCAAASYVKPETVQAWPSSVVSALYAEAQEMHRLPTADEGAAKNV